MSRIDIRKLAIVFLVPMIILATTGLAYAMWSETLKINVTVKTGEVDVKWSSWDCTDKGIDPGYDKDVGKCSVTSEATDDEGETIKLNVTLSNAYPCYNVTIFGEVDNVGTIPVKPYMIFYDANGDGKFNTSDGDFEISLCRDYGLDLDGDGKADIDIHLYLAVDGDNDGSQIDPGSSDTYGLIIHVKQDAKELQTYQFHLVFVFAQWNEVGVR